MMTLGAHQGDVVAVGTTGCLCIADIFCLRCAVVCCLLLSACCVLRAACCLLLAASTMVLGARQVLGRSVQLAQ
jgi:hypothetical protein